MQMVLQQLCSAPIKPVILLPTLFGISSSAHRLPADEVPDEEQHAGTCRMLHLWATDEFMLTVFDQHADH